MTWTLGFTNSKIMDVAGNMGSLSILLLLGAVIMTVDASNDTGVCNTTKLSESKEFTLEKVDLEAQVLSPCLPANLTAFRLQTKGDLVRLKLLEPPVDVYVAYRDKDAGTFQMVQRDEVPAMYAEGENSTMDFCDKEIRTVILFVSPLEGPGSIEKVLPEHLQVTLRAFHGGNEQKLYSTLFTDYNMKVRPVWNASEPVHVALHITINQIVEMDERNQILTTNLWIEQHWFDQKLVWDPKDYDGIVEMRIPATEIWVPDVTLYDNADSNDYVAHSRSSNAIVGYCGKVDLWSKPTLVKSTCKIDVKYFPFDMQECSMKFGSWTYTSFQMNLTKLALAPELSELVPNEQWNLEYAVTRRHSVKYECCPERYLDVTFYFGLKRKPLYYIYNLLMPCMLLSSLSLLGFFMPYDVGVVKVSLSITLILSLTVFLLLVAEMMPRTSEEVPLIGQYYAATMFMISISTAMNVFVLNINEKGGLVHAREVPKWLHVIALEYLAVIFWVTPCPCAKMTQKKGRPQHEHHELRYKPVNNQNTHIVTFDTTSPRNGGVTNNHVVGNRGSRYMNGPTPPDFDTVMREQNGNESETVSERRLARMEKVVSEILKHLKALDRKKEKSTQLKKDWALVAKVLDRLLLMIFFSSTVVTTICLLSQRAEDKVPPAEEDWIKGLPIQGCETFTP